MVRIAVQRAVMVRVPLEMPSVFDGVLLWIMLSFVASGGAQRAGGGECLIAIRRARRTRGAPTSGIAGVYRIRSRVPDGSIVTGGRLSVTVRGWIWKISVFVGGGFVIGRRWQRLRYVGGVWRWKGVDGVVVRL